MDPNRSTRRRRPEFESRSVTLCHSVAAGEMHLCRDTGSLFLRVFRCICVRAEIDFRGQRRDSGGTSEPRVAGSSPAECIEDFAERQFSGSLSLILESHDRGYDTGVCHAGCCSIPPVCGIPAPSSSQWPVVQIRLEPPAPLGGDDRARGAKTLAFARPGWRYDSPLRCQPWCRRIHDRSCSRLRLGRRA